MLDEARAQLHEDRATSLLKNDTEKEHQNMLQQLQQLNLFRESNALLRQDHERDQKKILELQEKKRKMEEAMRPLREEKDQLIGLRDLQNVEKNALVEENNRWKQRVQQLIDKYQRVLSSFSLLVFIILFFLISLTQRCQ